MEERKQFKFIKMVEEEKKFTYLNRFTQSKYALDMLDNLVLKIPTPESWPDKNDSKPLLEYCKAKKHNKIFTICFSIEIGDVQIGNLGEKSWGDRIGMFHPMGQNTVGNIKTNPNIGRGLGFYCPIPFLK